MEEEKGSKISVLESIASVNGMPLPSRIAPHWLETVRKRSWMLRSSGFPNQRLKSELMALQSTYLSLDLQCEGEWSLDSLNSSHSDRASAISLWERLGRAALADIDSNEFPWHTLSSLHHIEHRRDKERSDNEMNKALQVTVNSGGVVFFALFRQPESNDLVKKEAAAVIKIASSRMATLSESLGYEFAKQLDIRTPHARVVHNLSSEWQKIKEGAEKAREVAALEGDEMCELTCSELLEALKMSRCLLLMNYIHGSPLSESHEAFSSKEVAERTASALGRILVLDLVIRNEDRLPCHELGWRGNSTNLLYTDTLEEAFASSRGKVQAIPRERRATLMDGILGSKRLDPIPGSSNSAIDSPRGSLASTEKQSLNYPKCGDSHIVAIDSGVPRCPPSGKRAIDQAKFPEFVELILNSSEYAAKILCEVTGEKMRPADTIEPCYLLDNSGTVSEFQAGFGGAITDLQEFHLFLRKLTHRLENLLKLFVDIIDNASSDDYQKGNIETESVGLGFNYSTTISKGECASETIAEITDSVVHKVGASPASTSEESPQPSSPISQDNWRGKHLKARAEHLAIRIRDFSKYAKVDEELHREFEKWNELLQTDVIKLCNEHNFNTGFFDGTDNYVVDAYELKIRLEHIMERISLISDAKSTEKPSMVFNYLFIGGIVAARSRYTLQQLGITHILCLCANDAMHSSGQFPNLFMYKNFSIDDRDDARISDLFHEASDFVEEVEQLGKKVLVHCFEGKSRSATIVFAYLMLRKGYRLVDAWNLLKKVHPQTQLNGGFARCLLELDKKLHGNESTVLLPTRSTMKVCPQCGINVGPKKISLKRHMQEKHGQISFGSVDSAMTMETHNALGALKHGSISSRSVDSAIVMETRKVLEALKITTLTTTLKQSSFSS